MGIIDDIKRSLGMDGGHAPSGEPTQREGESDEAFAQRRADEAADSQTAVNSATTAGSITT